ncbi:MAG: S9 family peptidase [Bacteroidales bacterium]|nr:S9 family peptidase [Bacteroidales bacterium]
MKYGKLFCTMAAAAVSLISANAASDGDTGFNKVPVAWKWLNSRDVIFSYDGTYCDSTAFVFDASRRKTRTGVSAPAKYADFPVNPEWAVNMTYSPDSTKIAFTRDNDLYVIDIATENETRLTFDGTDLIMNGYASWVYYEEILGRPSRYRAFWWSPDGKKIGFYRFDNTMVPLFPIYSPFGQDGSLNNTRYPKAGETNPAVRIGIIDLDGVQPVPGCADAMTKGTITWADFDENEDQYFGIPFWSADSREFFIARMPRIQNTLDLYAVSAADGSKRHVYHEDYKTWLDWIDGVVFTDDGLYMARSFETGWEQIYFLPYDGSGVRRLTDGTNWGISIVRVDGKKGDVYFTAKRDSQVRPALYKVDRKGIVTALTDPVYYVQGVKFSPDGKYFAAAVSNGQTPTKVIVSETARQNYGSSAPSVSGSRAGSMESSRWMTVAADMAGGQFNPSSYALPQIVTMKTDDGFELYAQITYPADFDASRKYPVHVDIYGGPNTPLVHDRWMTPNESNQWWSENGIIQVVADCRAAGHNGRAGTDMVYRNLTEWPVRDFISWAGWLKSLPYVDGEKIGVEGFSFGGTMTSMLLFRAPESYHYGIAGGGVYDWALYDSHYTERFMETPQSNPEGYKAACALEYVSGYPVTYSASAGSVCCDGEGTGDSSCGCAVEPVMLKITHGTGDDNVHFQNTLQLIDVLHREGKKFDFMIYPDGMHGYRGYQGEHFRDANREFWLRYLKR